MKKLKTCNAVIEYGTNFVAAATPRLAKAEPPEEVHFCCSQRNVSLRIMLNDRKKSELVKGNGSKRDLLSIFLSIEE